MVKIPKHVVLPLAFGGLGVGYFIATYLARPAPSDLLGQLRWERHAHDAKIALVFGLGAGAVLWATRGAAERPRPSLF
jgi:hypothetical protein